MTVPTFSLMGIWRLRKADRDECRLAIAATLHARQQIAVALADIVAQIEQFQVRRRHATGPGVVRVEWLQDDLRQEELLRRERQTYQDEAARLEAQLQRQQEQLAEADVQWRAIEWLREHRPPAAHPDEPAWLTTRSERTDD